MAGLWDRLRGRIAGTHKDRVAEALSVMFAGYPPNRPLHAGAAETLSDTALDANLAAWINRRDERLHIVSNFLYDRGVGPAPMLDRERDGTAAARAIDAWLDKTLPRRPFSPVTGDDTPNPPYLQFRASDRSGADIYYSFLSDLGLLEGEAIRRRDPRFDWAINRLPDFADMGSYRRICLIKPGDRAWATTVFAMDEHMLSICHPKMAPRGNISGHRFGELLDGAMVGAFDPY